MSAKDRIAELRKNMGLTQEAFGKELGFSDGMISQIEAGKRNLNNRTVDHIAHKFGVSHKWLLTGTGDMYSQQQNLTTDEANLIDMYRQLVKPMQEFVIMSVRGLVEQQNKKTRERNTLEKKHNSA